MKSMCPLILRQPKQFVQPREPPFRFHFGDLAWPRRSVRRMLSPLRRAFMKKQNEPALKSQLLCSSRHFLTAASAFSICFSAPWSA